MQGKGSKNNEGRPVEHGIGEHALSEKTVADISEAIIGAILVSAKTVADPMALRAITRLVNSPDHNIQAWSDFAALWQPPAWQLETRDPIANDLANKLQKIGYTFRHPRLLRSAFTHPSDMHATVPDYQCLEVCFLAERRICSR